MEWLIRKIDSLSPGSVKILLVILFGFLVFPYAMIFGLASINLTDDYENLNWIVIKGWSIVILIIIVSLLLVIGMS